MSYYGKKSTFDADSAYCTSCERETPLTHTQDESYCSICGQGPKNQPKETISDHTIAEDCCHVNCEPGQCKQAEEFKIENKPVVKHKTEECEHGVFYVTHPCRHCGTLTPPIEKEDSENALVSIGFGVEIVNVERWNSQGRKIETPEHKQEQVRVLICGGRNYNDKEKMSKALFKILGDEINIVMCHGAARGADTLAALWAKECFIPATAFPADWDRYGNAAGVIRNAQMLREFKPNLVIAFPGGTGTANMVMIARRAKVKVIQVV